MSEPFKLDRYEVNLIEHCLAAFLADHILGAESGTRTAKQNRAFGQLLTKWRKIQSEGGPVMCQGPQKQEELLYVGRRY